jgi:hypothetical protein
VGRDGEPWRVTKEEWELLPSTVRSELLELSREEESLRSRLPGHVKQLLNGYELRVWYAAVRLDLPPCLISYRAPEAVSSRS